MIDALQVFAIILTYGLPAVGAGTLMYRVLVTRGYTPNGDTAGPGAFLTGVFWPIGLWLAIGMYLTTPKLARRDRKELRDRQNAALKQMQLIETEKMEHEVEKARFLLDLDRARTQDAQMKALEARINDSRRT